MQIYITAENCQQRTGFSFDFINFTYQKYRLFRDDWDILDFCCLLNYYRTYPTMREFAAKLWLPTHGNLFRDMKELSILLSNRLSEMQDASYLTDQTNLITWREFNIVGAVDTFPIYIERPEKDQELYYNGKYGTHVLKIQGFSDNRSNIFAYSGPHLGASHDIRIYRSNTPFLPDNCFLLGDKAYVSRNWQELKVIAPFKKRRNRELTDAERNFNREMKPLRVRVEHSYGFLKRFEILSGVYRGRIINDDNSPTELDRAIKILMELNHLYLKTNPIRELHNLNQ